MDVVIPMVLLLLLKEGSATRSFTVVDKSKVIVQFNNNHSDVVGHLKLTNILNPSNNKILMDVQVDNSSVHCTMLDTELASEVTIQNVVHPVHFEVLGPKLYCSAGPSSVSLAETQTVDSVTRAHDKSQSIILNIAPYSTGFSACVSEFALFDKPVICSQRSAAKVQLRIKELPSVQFVIENVRCVKHCNISTTNAEPLPAIIGRNASGGVDSHVPSKAVNGACGGSVSQCPPGQVCISTGVTVDGDQSRICVNQSVLTGLNLHGSPLQLPGPFGGFVPLQKKSDQTHSAFPNSSFPVAGGDNRASNNTPAAEVTAVPTPPPFHPQSGDGGELVTKHPVRTFGSENATIHATDSSSGNVSTTSTSTGPTTAAIAPGIIVTPASPIIPDEPSHTFVHPETTVLVTQAANTSRAVAITTVPTISVRTTSLIPLTTPTTDACGLLQCRNNGSCIATGESAACVCSTGYYGRTCAYRNSCESAAESGGCQNGGVCQPQWCPQCLQQSSCQSGDLNCIADRCEENDCEAKEISGSNWNCSCATGFQGQLCESAGALNSNSSTDHTKEIVGGIFGSILLVGLLVGGFFLFRYIRRSRKLKGKYNPAKEEIIASGSGPPMELQRTANKEERLI